jgi:hypothetical protein
MWHPSSLTTRKAVLDFSSSGGESFSVTQLVADGECLANAIELIDWAADPIQVRVCEKCGITHCEPGGWISLRRMGSYLLMIPAFANLTDDATEYQPPHFPGNRGIVQLDLQNLVQLQSFVPELPAIESMKALSNREAALIFQWEAPGRVLGARSSFPVLKESKVVASDPGDTAERIETLNKLLEAMHCSEAVAVLQTVADGTPAVTFFLDLPETPAWEAYVEGEIPALILCPGLSVRIPTPFGDA